MPTFSTNVPNGSQSPGQFPAQNNDNFVVLKDIINRDHIFNDTPAGGDNSGTHRQMTMTSTTDPVALPAGTNGIIYLKTAIPQFYNGTRYTQLAPVLARITWNSGGTVQGTPFNATVVQTAPNSGIYDITFTNLIPSIYQQFSLTCFEPSTNPAIGKVLAYTTGGMQVRFVNQNGSTITNITQGNLVVFGI